MSLWLAFRLHKVNKPTRISCHAALDMAACAAFRKESRMKFANATNLDRKSGEAAQANLEIKRVGEPGRDGSGCFRRRAPGRLGVAAEDLGRQASQATSLSGLSAAAREVGDDQGKHDSND